MARRGLVSKNLGPHGGAHPGAGAALMPKGESGKPQSNSYSVEEVADKLNVKPNQVQEWLKSGILRSDPAKQIRQYDFKKFQFEQSDEIRKAQTKALQDTQQTTDRKPNKKGFLAKFRSIFGQEDDEGGAAAGDGSALRRENERLKRQLAKLKADQGSTKERTELEDKVLYLEKKVSESRELEAQVLSLRRQLEERSEPEQLVSADELARLQQNASIAEQTARENRDLRETLAQLEQERGALLSQVEQAPDPETVETLQAELSRARTELEERAERLTLQEAQALRAQELEATVEQLRKELLEAAFERDRLRQETHTTERRSETGEAEEVEGAPVGVLQRHLQTLLELQATNLQRYRVLRQRLTRAEEALAQARPLGTTPETGSPDGGLQQEETARMRRELTSLDESVMRLSRENEQLKTKLQKSDPTPWKARVRELETVLEQRGSKEPGTEVLESELKTLRKNLQNRENQVQKMAGRLQDNERALDKAMKESARLTELLIEREGRLRDLAAEYEQEYRAKIDNLDRQVSGLQWKLSLREERIAQLESELLKNSPR